MTAKHRAVSQVAPGFVLVLVLVLTGCGTRIDKNAFANRFQPGPQDTSGYSPVPEQSYSANPTNPTGSSIPVGSTTLPTVRSTGSGPAPTPVSNLSRTKVGDTIRLGLHVPETGAAPLPTNWKDSLGAIQDYINAEARPYGRKVQFLVEDDGYDPSKGLAACKKIAGGNPIAVVGHTMPAVQDACARLFGERRIPYLMRGVSEAVLRGRPLAYFGTISAERQARLLADYIVRQMNGKTKKVAVLNENDEPIFRTTFVNQVRADGGSVVIAEDIVVRQSDYSATIQKLRQANAQIVVMKLAPVDAIKISVQSQGIGYHPTWMGPGTSWNYNMALEAAGMALDGAVSFSPWCSIDSPAADQFRLVMAKYRPHAVVDDIGLIMWGWIGLIRTALNNAGQDLSVASLVGALNSLSFASPSWNPIVYSGADHRGASSVVVMRGDGQTKRWRQTTGFSSRF